MNEPSDGVPQALLLHIHLVSTFPYPLLAQLPPDVVVDHLLQAPTITRQTATMMWKFLDAPIDGTVLLVWQPSQLGNSFASDGYIWDSPEQVFTLDVKGYTLEMYQHKCGYRPGVETIAVHGRRRYRLTPSKTLAPSMPIDSSLWLVHYFACPPGNRLPSSSILLTPHTQRMLSERQYIQNHGQLVRKEFMLHDRPNWPTISLPGGRMPRPFTPQGPIYPAASQTPGGRGMPPGMFHPQQPTPQGGLGPSPRRPQTFGPGQAPGAAMVGPMSMGMHPGLSVEDQEDTSHGDILDHLTPREISMVRYKQHHEWMEEIMSPYPLSRITPVDLGLDTLAKTLLEGTHAGVESGGEAGEPTLKDIKDINMLQRLAEKRTAEAYADLEKMKRRHERRMTKLRGDSAASKNSELRLRDMLEEVDVIVKEFEAATGKRVEPTKPAVLVHAGGLEEAPKSYENMHDVYPVLDQFTNRQMGHGATNDNSAGQMLDQLGNSTVTTPGASLNVPRLPEHGASAAGTPTTEFAVPTIPQQQLSLSMGADNSRPEVQTQISTDGAIPQISDMDMDVEMAGVPNDHRPTSGSNSQSPALMGDWVMVGKEGENQPQDALLNQESLPPGEEATIIDKADIEGAVQMTDVTNEAMASAAPVAEGEPESTVMGQYGDFDNLNSAGEELAAYEQPGAGMTMGGDIAGLDLADSGFGDALNETGLDNGAGTS